MQYFTIPIQDIIYKYTEFIFKKSFNYHIKPKIHFWYFTRLKMAKSLQNPD